MIDDSDGNGNTNDGDYGDRGDWQPIGYSWEAITIIVGGLTVLAAVIAAAKIPFPEW